MRAPLDCIEPVDFRIEWKQYPPGLLDLGQLRVSRTGHACSRSVPGTQG